MVIAEIQNSIQGIAENLALYEAANFAGRADALDFVDFHIIDRIEALLPTATNKQDLWILHQRACSLKCKLEGVDATLFTQLRQNIRAGIYTAQAFRQMVNYYMPNYTAGITPGDNTGYDMLDVFINGLLGEKAVPEATLEREPGMVFYQKTPARIVLNMADRAALAGDDVFFDIGSGLGQAGLLVHLISGAATVGVEYEPAYCHYAKVCAAQLHLPQVEFIHTDARTADYSRGTVFFMYTPFEGRMLQDVLGALHKQSLQRKIRVFTYGPCWGQVAGQHWLIRDNGETDGPYNLHAFTSV